MHLYFLSWSLLTLQKPGKENNKKPTQNYILKSSDLTECHNLEFMTSLNDAAEQTLDNSSSSEMRVFLVIINDERRNTERTSLTQFG